MATLALAVTLMGTGYAYWTDQLTISNTVSTGVMNVEFVDLGAGLPIGLAGDSVGESRYLTSNINQNDAKTTTITLSNMYPGTVASYFAAFENKGSIPAVFDNVEVNFDPLNTNQELVDNVQTIAGYFLMDKNNNQKGGNLVYVTDLDQLETQLNNLFRGLRLEPGDYVLLDVPEEAYNKIRELAPGWEPAEGHSLHFVLPYNVDNSDNAEETSAKFDIKINWKQHNA